MRVGPPNYGTAGVGVIGTGANAIEKSPSGTGRVLEHKMVSTGEKASPNRNWTRITTGALQRGRERLG